MVLLHILSLFLNWYLDVILSSFFSPFFSILLSLPVIIKVTEFMRDLKNPAREPFPDRNYECEIFKVNYSGPTPAIYKGSIKETKKKHFIGVFVKTVIALILVIVLILIIYVGNLLCKLNTYSNDTSTTSTSDEYDLVSKSNSSDFSELIANDVTNVEEIKIAALDNFDESMLDIDPENVKNILLIGSDTRKNSYEDIGNTDSMILLSIDTKNKNVKLTSFMRDMYVPIPNHGSNRLNAAFSYGGPKLLFETLKANFDVDVDEYIVINFDNFKKIIDEVGGVDIELTSAEARYMNKYSEKYHTDLVEAGLQTLDGSQALSYARCRKIDSDFNRTERQRKIIKAFVEKVKTCNIIELNRLLNDFIPMVYTNISKLDILSLLVNSYNYMNKDIETMNVPIKNSCVDANINEMSVLSPNFALNKKAIKIHIYSSYRLDP